MPIAERMKLAEGRPVRRKMMAAMAQQDCGQCGYNCARLFAKPSPTSAESGSICACRAARKPRACSRRCSRRRRRHSVPPKPRRAVRTAARAQIAAAGRRSRDNPAKAVFLSRRQLNGEARRRRPGISSSISRSRASIMLSATAFGVFRANDPALVDAILIAMLGARPDFPIGGQAAARGSADRGLAVARARHAVRTALLRHRRRAGARRRGRWRRRRSRRRCRQPRRAGGAGEIFRPCAPTRKRSSRRWSRCSRGSTRSPRRPRHARRSCR